MKYPKTIIELAKCLKQLDVKCKTFRVKEYSGNIYKVYTDKKYFGLYDYARKTFVE